MVIENINNQNTEEMKLKKVLGLFAAPLLCTAAFSQTLGLEYEGILYSDLSMGGGLTATAPWDIGSILSYSAEPVEGGWLYSYSLDVGHKSPSHLIVGMCPTVGGDNIWDLQFSGGSTIVFGDFSSEQGGSNPGLEGSIWGMKIDTQDDSLHYDWSFVSDRTPATTAFYAKDGMYQGESVYMQSSEGSGVLAPGCSTIPEPSTTFALFGTIGIALLTRRRTY